MKINELIECFREIVKTSDESQKNEHPLNGEIIYWRNKFLNSVRETMYDDEFIKIKHVFLSLPSETFLEKNAEEWINLIMKGFNNEIRYL